MNGVVPWLRVGLAVLIYVGFALLATAAAQKIGSNLREMGGRTSNVVIVLGLTANLAVLGIVLLMLRFIDDRPLSSLGFHLSSHDIAALMLATLLASLLAAAFLAFLRKTGSLAVHPQPWTVTQAGTLGLAMVVAVLGAVAAQEEVLYRGYLSLNLIDSGWVVVIAASVVIFTSIHLITNKFNAYQISSWAMGGAVLIAAYLVSGSILLAILLHFMMDILNVIAFGIVGRYSLVEISPPLNDQQRSAYRAFFSIAILLMLVAVYGTGIRVS